MINVNMDSPDGVTLATSGKYCEDNIEVKQTFLQDDTVTPELLVEGVTAHNAAGDSIVGTIKHRFFEGEIVSTVLGSVAYAVLCKDQIIADHFNDTNLRIDVRFDLESTPYSVVETIGFNISTATADINVLHRIGQHVMRYDSSGIRNINKMGVAINGDNDVGASEGVGMIRITEDGEVRIYSKSSNYAIRPSKYTVEVNWYV